MPRNESKTPPSGFNWRNISVCVSFSSSVCLVSLGDSSKSLSLAPSTWGMSLGHKEIRRPTLPSSGTGSLLHSTSSTLLEEGSEVTIFLCWLSTATVSVSVDLTSSGSASFCFSRNQVSRRAASQAWAAEPRRRGCYWKGQGRCWGPGSGPDQFPRTSGAPGRGSVGGPSWISNVARILTSWVWRWRLACPPDPHTLVKVSKSCLISP